MISKTCLLWAVLGFALLPLPAHALVEGEPHALYQSHRIFGAAVVTGNSLMTASASNPLVNSGLLPRSAGDVRGIPFDAELVAAYLFWTGSIAGRVDRNADLRAPGGENFNDVGADRCVQVAALGGAFYCRADVTARLRGAPGPQRWNGRWEVGDVQAEPGALDQFGQCIDPMTCQGKYAAWSLVLVYESPSERVLRDVFIHDGFRILDEINRTAGIDSFNIGGFDYPANGSASLSFFALEGDALLGVPPQDTDPVSPCATCFDFLEFRGVKLSDATNPPNNLFNSTSPGGATLGVDIDTFDVSGLLRPGDQQVRLRAGSGDGMLEGDQPHGNGEAFFLGYVLLNVERNAPNFRREGTILSVVPDEAAPRERVVITLSVANEGSLDALNTLVRLALPAGLTYLPGSLRLDGNDPVPGEEAQNPLVNGLRLGNVPFQGDNTRVITLRATLDDGLRPGQRLVLQGRITADNLPEPTLTNEAVVVVLGAVGLGRLTKAVVDGDGDDRFAPGEVIQYQFAFENPNDREVLDITFTDRLPPYVDLLQVVAATGEDQSRPEEGFVQLVGMEIPARGTARVTLLVRIHDAAELAADGVPAGGLNGFAVSNQAEVVASGERRLTDDPDTAALNDPTVFRLSTAVDITGPNTRKTATDVNGGRLEPGDRIGYVIDISNGGVALAEVAVRDPLPAGTEDCRIESNHPELVCANGLLQGTVQVPASGRIQVIFSVAVAANAAHDLAIQNVATLRAVADPSQVVEVRSEVLRVLAAHILTATKDVVGLPGRTALPGERLRYVIRVTNSGNRAALELAIFDVITFPFAEVVPEDGGRLDAGRVSWRIPRLDPGATVEVAFEALLPPVLDDNTRVPNQAQAISVSSDVPRIPAVLSDDPITAAALDPTVVRVRSQARIEVAKDVQPRTARPGEAVTYTLRVRNTGTADGVNVRITDRVPAGVFGALVAEGGRVAGEVVTFNAASRPELALLPVGGEVELVLRGTLLPVLSNGLRVENQATAVAMGVAARLSDDPTTAEVGDPTVFVVESTPGLALDKAVIDLNGGDVQPGDRLRYVLTVRGTGDAPAEAVEVTDPVPAGLVDVAPASGGRLKGGTLLWSLPAAVVPGTPVELSFEATVDPATPAGTRIANQAESLANGVNAVRSDDPSVPGVADPTEVVVVSRPDLSTSTKDAQPRQVEPGQVVAWRIEVVNSGTAPATDVVVRDPLPAELEALEAPGGAIAGSTVTWNLGVLAPGERRVLEVRGTVRRPLAPTVLSNQAELQALDLASVFTDDPTTPEVDDPTLVQVNSVPRLVLEKTVVDTNGAPVEPGDALVFTLRLTNTGGDTARQVVVADQFDGFQAFVAASAGGRLVPPTTVQWPRFDLAPDEVREFTLTTRLAADIANGTVAENTATAQAENGEPVRSDDPTTPDVGDPTRVRVVSGADFSNATKTLQHLDGGPEFRPGDRIRYTMVFTNEGTDAARQTVVTDILPPELVLENARGAVVNGQTLTWNLAQLAVGASRELVVDARLAAPLPNGAVVANQASINAQGFAQPFLTDDPTTPEGDDPTRLTVTADAVLALQKALVTRGPIQAGEPVEYRIRLENSGDALAVGVVVTDAVPRELTLVAAPGAAIANGVVTWNAPPVAPGTPVELTLTGVVLADTPAGTVVRNQAFAGKLASNDPVTPAPNDATVFTVQNVPELLVEKRIRDDNGGDFAPGDPVTFTLTVRNVGLQPAPAVDLIDEVDARFADPQPIGGRMVGRTARWDLGDLAPGAEEVVTLRATIAAGLPDGTVLANEAGARFGGQGPYTFSEEVRITLVAGRAALVVQKVVASPLGGVFQGNTVEYAIRVVNEGPFASPQPVLVDGLPAGVTYVAGSTTLDGAPFPDRGGGAPFAPPGMGLRGRDGVLAAGEEAVVRFSVEVDAPPGTRIENQGVVDDGLGVVALSDDPDSPQPFDPTAFVVQGDINLTRFVKTARVLGRDTVRAQVGDVIEWTLLVTNSGTTDARQVRVEDDLPARTTYVPGSTTLAGASVTDIVDADRGQVVDGRLSVRIDRVPAGGQRQIRFRTTVNEGPTVQNQGRLDAGDGVVILSDDNGEGRDPTIVPVGDEPVRGITIEKTVDDPSGPPALAGEALTWRITVANTGTVDLGDLVITDDLPAGLVFQEATALPPGAELEVSPAPAGDGNGQVRISQVGVVAGESVTIVLVMAVDPTLAANTQICNEAQVEGPGVAAVVAKLACVDAEIRFGGVVGRVFEDLDGDAGFSDGDVGFADMKVTLHPMADPDGPATFEALSAEGGTFALLNLPVGAYRVRVFSATKVLMATRDDVQVVEETELSLIIDPSGRVYESQEGTLVDGAQVFIYRDEDTNNDPYDEASRRLRTLVPLEDLEAESMQGQRTAHGGVYRFAVRRAGRYLMEVVPPGLSQISPSLLVPPVPGYAFTDDPDRNVVPDAVPVVAPGADRTYFLAFELNGIEDEFFHNHVPIDALSSLIDLQKRSRRVEVTRGQVVTYEIDIINRSPRDLITGSETGPAVLQDVLPKGFKYVAGSGTWTRVQSGKEIPLATFDPAEARILRFPVEINAGEALRLRYQAALGANVKARAVYTNRAQLLLAGGNVPISRVATADVRVVPDADFDQGALIGKVFCDTNTDGLQSEGELGLAGVRLYLDTGWYAETDSGGLFHFQDLDPGSHAVKVDAGTLLPGATFTTDALRVIHFTPGLPAKVSFGVTCPTEEVSGARIEVAGEGVAGALAALRDQLAVVSGDAKKLTARVRGVQRKAAKTLVKLQVDGADVETPDLPAGAGGAAANLAFAIRVFKGAPRDRWALWLGELGEGGVVGEEKLIAHGPGRPPKKLDWNQLDAQGQPVLQAGKAYAYRLELGGRDGELVGSPAGVFGVGVGGGNLPPLIELVEGDFAQGQPSAALQKGLRRVKLPAEGRIRVEVHGDGSLEAGPARAQTEQEAAAVVAWMVATLKVPAERLEARGIGNDRPRVPTTFERSKKRNRRVELRSLAGDAVAAPLELVATFKALARVDGHEVLAEEDGAFATVATVPEDGVVELFVQAEDGRRAVFAVALKEGTAPERAPKRAVAIEGTAPSGLTIGGLPLVPAGLKVEAEGPEAVGVSGGAFEKPVEFRLASGLKQVSRWRFAVLGADGQVAFEQQGVGQPPATLSWAGAGAGVYRYRLTVRSTREVVGQSPEGVLVAGDATKPIESKEKNAWSLRVDGQGVSKEGNRFSGTTEVRGDEALLIELGRPDGGRALFFVVPPAEGADGGADKVRPVAPVAGGAERVGGGPLPAEGRTPRKALDEPALLEPGQTETERALMAAFGQEEVRKLVTPALGDTGADVPARVLTLTVPPAGSELPGRSVPVRGRTAPGNRVFLQGNEVVVDAEGRFAGGAWLDVNDTELRVTTQDPAGNKGVITHPLKVKPSAWFLLALGEGQAGSVGNELAGVEAHTRTTVGDSIYLHGRAAGFFKGYMKGSDVLGGAFDQYKVTAHVDSARRREFEGYFRQVIDPEAFYPVYGDSAALVKDANSRGPIYVLVEADQSTLTVGNFKSGIRGVELLNYDRMLYGAGVALDVKQGVARHELKAFAADQEVPERHAYIEMLGTGGSLYFLPHRELIEGSERVSLVERDRTSGIERRRVTLGRDTDYTIRYGDGRILLKSPANTRSLDTAGALPQPNDHSVLDGHPLFIAVEYDHQDPGQLGESAFGVHARETLFEKVTVGGGYVQEGRDGVPDYRLWGGELRVRHGRKTRFEAEVARSEGQNGENLLSLDGGLTFRPFHNRSAALDQGTSFLLRGGLELADFMEKSDHDQWYTEGWYQYLAPGFSSGGTIQQQGQEIAGLQSRYWLTPEHSVFARYDVSVTEQPATQGDGLFGGFGSFRRDVVRGGYGFVRAGLKLDVEFVHTETDEGPDEPGFVLDTASVSGEYPLNDRWTLLAEQELVVRGDERLHSGTGDLFVTSAGARFRIDETLSIEAIESLRWSGDNATQVGMRTEISDRHTIYANERFVNEDGDFRSTTVLGGEERFGAKGSGRAFGEYQLETGSHGGANRAVVGVGKKTKVIEGLHVDTAYQRSQVVSGGQGEFSQDALSLGVEWLDSQRVKVGGRYELRYDDNDESQDRRDLMQVTLLNAGSFKVHPDLTLLLRFNYSHSLDLGLEATAAELLEMSAGLAFRPVAYDWVAVLVKYSKRYAQNPIDVVLELPEREEIDVISATPIFELPYGFQALSKVAWKRTALRVASLPTVEDENLLVLLRLNYHLTNTWDAGAEYRWMTTELAQTTLDGALVEVNYILQKTVRLGLGYNFSSFSDEEFARLSEDHGGPFFRVIAHY